MITIIMCESCSPEGKDGAHRVEGEELLWQGLAFRLALVVDGCICKQEYSLPGPTVKKIHLVWDGALRAGYTHCVVQGAQYLCEYQ